MRPPNFRPPDFWTGAEGTFAAQALSPLGWVWSAAGRVRRALAHSWHAPARVLCIGNLTVGGAGKTPLALDLARRILARGHAVHFLTRGYGGRIAGPLRVDSVVHDFRDVGDEALLLARVAPTWVGVDRVKLARAACEDGARVLVMDDGFQNPALAKDMSLLVVDGAIGFGNGRVMPAGPLREEIADGLKRADAVVIVGADERGAAKRIEAERPDLPRLGVRIAPGAARVKGRPVFAFAGIGRPGKFFATATAAGAVVRGTAAFPDHHLFTAAEIEDVCRRAARLGAVPLTTAKDAIRLPPGTGGGIEVLTMDLVWENEAGLDALLETLLRDR